MSAIGAFGASPLLTVRFAAREYPGSGGKLPSASETCMAAKRPNLGHSTVSREIPKAATCSCSLDGFDGWRTASPLWSVAIAFLPFIHAGFATEARAKVLGWGAFGQVSLTLDTCLTTRLENPTGSC